MIRRVVLAMSAISLLSAAPAPTFSKNVAPILYQRCVSCHRPGEVAPMSLIDYKDVRPWAKSIKAAVLQHAMPPWLADPSIGHFANDRRLSQAEIATLVSWVDNGTPEGNPADLPAAPKFEPGWTIGEPDRVIDMGVDFDVPTAGVVPYKHFTVDPGFTQDKWIERAEIRPDQRQAVHHVIVYILPPGVPESAAQGERSGERREMLAGFAPGDPATIFEPGTARLIKAGSKLIFQIHYMPNGKECKDRSYIGLIYAKQSPKYRSLITNPGNGMFVIPSGDPNYEVKSSWEAKEDVTVTSLMPHMHVRGKDYKYTATYPDGRQEVILNVPRYDFNWQLTYELKEPIKLPKGTKVEGLAHFDNSPNNKFNPDPSKEVRFGPQIWEEMMLGWFSYVVPVEKANLPGTGANAHE